MKFCSVLFSGLVLHGTSAFTVQRGKNSITHRPATSVCSTSKTTRDFDDSSFQDDIEDDPSRRNLLHIAGVATSVLLNPFTVQSAAAAATGANDGNLPDLPKNAVQSYLQYRVAFQIAADFYIFDLQDKVSKIDEWGDVNQLVVVSNARGGQGQPSRIERDFVNPMRLIGLTMPPDIADQMRDAQFKFERAMSKMTKATAGYRRDLPVEVDKSSIVNAKASWEEGRLALNEFFLALNDATGLKEMKGIPPSGPNQASEYGRSQRKYIELMKKTKLCQNRGGPALSQAWGQLMVSGYLQDSCGIPDLEAYFYQ